MGKRGTILLLHFVGQMPLAGIAWQAVHYLLGLRARGWEVWYIEDGAANPYDPRIASIATDCRYNLAHLHRVMERWGFAERWAYWDAVGEAHYGLSRERLRALYRQADGLINLCGATRLREEHLACPVRIFIDTDPGFEQIRYAKAEPAARAYLDAHTHFFSYGENLGAADCPIPLCGIDWRPTRPPVIPDLWSAGAANASRCFTTVTTWENKGKDIEFGDDRYLWSKHVNFGRFLGMPRHRPQSCFEIATEPPGGEQRRAIEEGGWRIIDPRPISAEMERYADFIRRSRGEFTVAKDIYVRLNSGWFSDRSVCYLAAGRPVVTMRTGFRRCYPVGRGLFDFATQDEALQAIDAIAADYPSHSRAALEIANECFAADRVLEAMLAQAGL